MTKREYWLLWKLINGLISHGYHFGKGNLLLREFEVIRDKCLDDGFDYKE